MEIRASGQTVPKAPELRTVDSAAHALSQRVEQTAILAAAAGQLADYLGGPVPCAVGDTQPEPPTSGMVDHLYRIEADAGRALSRLGDNLDRIKRALGK